MSVIREALARRAQGGGMPVSQQVSMPQSGQTPMQTPPSVQTGGVGMPQQAAQQPQPQQQSQGQGQKVPPNFDDATKGTAKALIARLIQVL